MKRAKAKAYRAGYLRGWQQPWSNADNPFDFTNGEEEEFMAFEFGFNHGSRAREPKEAKS